MSESMASKGDAALDDIDPDCSAVTDAAPEETVALYCRVSTDEQNLDRQRELTYEYATERLDVSPSAIEVYIDKGTGTNTNRRGYRDLMAGLEAGTVDRVVVSEVSRLSRSVRDFAASVERIVDEYDAALLGRAPIATALRCTSRGRSDVQGSGSDSVCVKPLKSFMPPEGCITITVSDSLASKLTRIMVRHDCSSYAAVIKYAAETTLVQEGEITIPELVQLLAE